MVVNVTIPSLFENVFCYPQLDTVLMVEKFIEDHSAEYKKKSLWQNLPKKMKYQTYCVIIDYLEYSNKIATDKEGKIVWIGITSGRLLKDAVDAK
jgi:hypothetical protein